MRNIEDIQRDIDDIKVRNKRVEIDKAWEVSWTRLIFISILTYMVAGAWLLIINESIPFLKAIVPTVGYVLSTISIPQVKKLWIKQHN